MNLYKRLRFWHRAWRFRLRYEKRGVNYLLSRNLAGKTVVDVGANKGVYSYWMHRKVGRTGRVFAFEPQPEMVEFITDMKQSFGLENLSIIPEGVSSKPTELRMTRRPGKWDCATFEDRSQESYEFEYLTIKVTTLDEHFTKVDARPVSFIKCDVEGHEVEVFRGGESILTEDRPDLLFECLYAEKNRVDVFAYLREIGYRGFCFYRDGFAPVEEFVELRPFIHKRAFKDFVFVPEERAHLVPLVDTGRSRLSPKVATPTPVRSAA